MGIAERLTAAGLSAREAETKTRLFEGGERLLDGASGGDIARWFVPGRIEVFGKHTDYAGGRSLLCAVERGFCVLARARSDRVVRVFDSVLGVEARVFFSEDAGGEPGNWTAYPAAVVRRVVADFPGPLRGADIAIASDLPRSAGLSSGSALVVAIFTALAHVNRLEDHPAYQANIAGPEDLAGYLGAVENGRPFAALAGGAGVGTFGGSEDHTAILCCRSRKLSQYSFCPVRSEREVALPPAWTFVVASSGVAAEKSAAARDRYNRLSLGAAAVFDLWRSSGGSGETLGQVAGVPGAPEQIRGVLRRSRHPDFSREELLGRFEQFFEESERLVRAAALAFEKEDAAGLGEIAARSQEGAGRVLGNQVPETTALVASARGLGAVASCAFGAGFGGSVWALIARERANEFRATWQDDYRRRFPSATESSEFFLTRAGPGRLFMESGSLP